MKNSFRDPVTGVLKAHGFVAVNAVGDISQVEVEDFALEPGKWRWNGSAWIPYTPPLTQEQQDVIAARTDDAITTLQNMTPAQARAWVGVNVTSLAEAKTLLGTMAAVLCILARRL